jgi:hypothetical protein
MTASLCLAIWCAFGAPIDGDARMVVGRDAFLTNERVEHLVLVEIESVFAGYITDQSVVVGVMPLHIGRGRLRLDGGVSVATAPVPLNGTRGNWVARLRYALTEKVTIEWLHFSNSGSGQRNPSLDALAIGWRF